MLDSIGSVKDVFNPQENTQQAKVIKEAEKPLKKYRMGAVKLKIE